MNPTARGNAPAVGLLLLLGLAACGGAAEPAKHGTNYQACFDGVCEVEVSKGTKIPVDKRFGLPPIEVTELDDDTVSLRSASETRSKDGYSSSELNVTVTPGSIGSLNGLEILVVSIDDGTAILRFSPPGT